MTSRLSRDQQSEVVSAVEALGRGDMDVHIRSFEDALTRAIEATAEEFWLWEDEAEDLGYQDEFSMAREDVEQLAPEWKLAYVARLLRSMALVYGLRVTEFDREPSALRMDANSVGGLLRSLNDAVHLPVRRQSKDK